MATITDKAAPILWPAVTIEAVGYSLTSLSTA